MAGRLENACWLARCYVGDVVFAVFLFSMLMIMLATALIWVACSVFWAVPARYLKGEAAAGGIALVNSIGALGGFLSSAIIGWVKMATGSFSMALYGLAAVLVMGAMPILFMRQPRPN